MIYYTSDFHFGHKRILDFERNQFKDINEHDRFIMTVLENRLSSQDELYFLGDLGWTSEEIAIRFKNLRGKKYMIIGNHDKDKTYLYKSKYGFTHVYKYPI